MADSYTEKVDAALADWPKLQELPQEIAGFRRSCERRQENAQYEFSRYDHADLHRAAIGFYDAVTDSYKLRVQIGVVSYALPSFVCKELGRFGDELDVYLPRVMEDLLAETLHTQELQAICDAVLAWEYGAALPEECEGFVLFIRPKSPAALTNGSYLVIDYVDFSQESDVGIYYNFYRDEFFCEYHIWGMPYVSYDFDAVDLEELEQRLKLYLVRYLKMVAAEAAKGRPA